MRMVLKYGGSSVATIEQIQAIANHVKELKKDNSEIVIVASAMGKTTNNLISLANQLSTNASKRELDALLSTGEIQSICLLAIALNELGVPAVSLSGFQAKIKTNNKHGKAFILSIDTKRIEKELRLNKVVLVAGFQGYTNNYDTTTLGRGGSDTTAVALASALKCKCEIFTDVEAVHTADPKLYASAKKLPFISYDEMMEMSACGAKVLEVRSVEIAKKFNVALYLGKSLETDKNKGTIVMKTTDNYFEKMPITNICIKQDVCLLIIKTHTLSNIPEIINILSLNSASLEMVSHTKYENEILFSLLIKSENTNLITQILHLNDITLLQKCDLTKVSVIGSGFSTHADIASKIFSVLLTHNLHFEQITTSEISICFLTKTNQKEEVINTLAKEFDL